GFELLSLGRREPEQLAERPVVVLAQRRTRSRVAVGRVAQAEAVALIEPIAHVRVRVRDEVLAKRDLRVLVDVAEVVDRYRFNAARLELLRALPARARRGPGLDGDLDVVDALEPRRERAESGVVEPGGP